MANEPADAAESAPAADDTEESQPKKPAAASKSGVLIMILVGFLVMLLTPVITLVLIKMTAPGEKKEEPKIEAPTQEGVVDLDPVVVNIKDTAGTRYLKATVHLVVSDPRLKDKFKDWKPRVRDTVITALMTKTLPELEGEKGREALKLQIKKSMNQILTSSGEMKGTVLDVYFSDYLIQ
jgi:flagellar basal body-associated protein FliL